MNDGISVIVTFCLADVHHLEQCLGSVKWQVGPDDELILIFDGEPEYLHGATAESLGVHYVSFTGDVKGVSAARNLGASLANGKWLKFLDVDDVLAPFALEAMRRYEGKAFVVKGAQTTIRDGVFDRELWPNEAGTLSTPDGKFVWTPGWKTIEHYNPALVSHCFILASAFLAVEGFDERIHFEEDWDFWLRIREEFQDDVLGYLNARVCYYCINTAERSAKVRDHTVEGKDVREYLRGRYGVTPK